MNQDEKDQKAAIKMYRNDVVLLCFAQLALIILIIIMIFIVLALTEDVVVESLIIASSVVLIAASVILVSAGIRHLQKNHMEINLADIRQKHVLRESKEGRHHEEE